MALQNHISGNRRSFALTLASCLVISGCGGVVDGCEQAIKRDLRSPSTFKKISANSVWLYDANPPHVSVSIEFDAANAYGTPIRHTASCDVPIRDGKAVVEEAEIDSIR